MEMRSPFSRASLVGLVVVFLGAVLAAPASADTEVTLKLRDEFGNGVAGGVATPACGGAWQSNLPGVTDTAGNLTAVLPACTTKVKMTVNQGSVEQTNAQLAASNYTWMTQILRIYLRITPGRRSPIRPGLSIRAVAPGTPGGT